jgi:hypothetical protein
MTNTDQTPLPTAKESVDACMRIIHTHAARLGSTDDKHAKNMGSKSPESSNYRTKPSSLIIVQSI